MRVRLSVVWLWAALLGSTLSAGNVAVGTVTVSSRNIFAQAGPVKQYTLSATSSAGGDTSANAFSVVPGWIEAVKFVPSSGGTQPSDQFDCALKDADGIDILNDQAADLSNSVGAYFQFTTPLFFTGSGASQTLDLVCSNAGNAKTWVVLLWVK